MSCWETMHGGTLSGLGEVIPSRACAYDCQKALPASEVAKRDR